MTFFSFVNDIVMTVTLFAVLLHMGRSRDVMQRYISVKVLINIQGMTPDRFHKECLKCLLPSRLKRNNKLNK